MTRRRVTVSPSNAPGMRRSAVYFDFFSGGVSAMGGRAANAIGCVAQDVARALLVRRVRAALAPARSAWLAPADRGGGSRSRRRRRSGRSSACDLRTQGDGVGKLRDRGQVAERGEPCEALGVAAVAVEQREVAVRRGPAPALASVVALVAVVHRGDARRAARRRGPRRAGRLPPAPPGLTASANAAARRLDRALHVLRAVREGREPRLELRRRRVDAAAPAARGTTRRTPRASHALAPA